VSAHASSAAVDAALERADQSEAKSVFTLRLDEEARNVAVAADARRAARSRARFLGVPITVKDNFDLMGHATTAGSKLLIGAPTARRDAPVVERLREAGFVLLGRTNMTEFAFSGLGLNPHYGTPANPAFPGERRIPGGSSSGTAVSVALGIVPAAIGTDTGGSIRIPAALCGITDIAARCVGLDALIWPTVPFTAPTIDSLADDSVYHATNGRALRNSTVANLLDGCAITVPCPAVTAPVGMTFAATHGHDDALLSVAITAQSILKGA